MPGLTGIQVVEALRNAGKLSCPIIATTGSVDDDMQREMKRAGFCGCLAKPFTAASMQAAINSALSSLTSSSGDGWFLMLA